ncbi:MAG TPA: four helix bundle protein [Chthoniobacterales bacterium]
MKAKTFEDLLVWKKAHAYVLEIYRITKQFPKSEIFGLTAQMRRAAVSIPANIAEGFKKRTPREKIRILNISQGSLEESRYYLILAEDLDYANTAVLLPKLEEVSRMLEAYIRVIETNHQIVRG